MQTPIRMPICFLFVWVCVSTPPTVIAADGDTDKVIWFAPHQTQIEECHQWAAIFWEWRETGIVPAKAINFHWSIEPNAWNTISMDEECAAVSAEYSSNGGFELVDLVG